MMNKNRKKLIEISELRAGYDRQEVILDISECIYEGEIICLLGPNGSGKSTLLKSINGTAKIFSGSVKIGEIDNKRLNRKEIARKVSVVAQENETRFPITVFEFVLGSRFAYLSKLGFESSVDLEFTETALELCGLAGFRNRLMNQLSGGERQRVLLARAFASGANALLMDEPTANLDLKHQVEIFEIIRKRVSGCGSGALIITHDLNLAAKYSDRIWLMHDGKLAASGTAYEVFREELLEKVFGIKISIEHAKNSRITVFPSFD
ncbi:MAG TPA: ABC transporter ATP-binding protein [Pyrinomonadaceae bacterium]|nr:ABC transporter ATP-binding protein [Pyrinomonadaceae bacterium]